MRIAAAGLDSDIRVLGLIGSGHFMSHLYHLTLPLLITFLARDYGLDPVRLGFFISAFALSAAVAQLPVGFVVDRYGARYILIAGLVLEASAIGAMAFTSSYPVLVFFAACAGLGHSVFHPADYAVMMSSIRESRIGRAFSMHTLSGEMGSAVAPALIAYMALLWHWKVALMIVSAFGLITALALASQMHFLRDHIRPKGKAPDRPRRRPIRSMKANLRLLLTPPVLILFAFFFVTAMATSGIQTFSIFTLVSLHGVPQTIASTALTCFLVATAVGVLAGGWAVDALPRHDLVASAAFFLTAAGLVLLSEVNLDHVFLISVFACIGILQGLVKPARDMMVRNAIPPGTAGTIFAFMSTGRLLGAAITPVFIGWLIAGGSADKVFLALALFSLLALATLHMPRKMSH